MAEVSLAFELVLQKVFIGSEDNIIRYEEVLRGRGESSI